MTKKQADKKKPKGFIRKNGKVIPIYESQKQKKAKKRKREKKDLNSQGAGIIGSPSLIFAGDKLERKVRDKDSTFRFSDNAKKKAWYEQKAAGDEVINRKHAYDKHRRHKPKPPRAFKYDRTTSEIVFHKSKKYEDNILKWRRGQQKNIDNLQKLNQAKQRQARARSNTKWTARGNKASYAAAKGMQAVGYGLAAYEFANWARKVRRFNNESKHI